MDRAEAAPEPKMALTPYVFVASELILGNGRKKTPADTM